MPTLEKYHAKTLKGLESLLAEELRALGASRTEVVNRGVDFYGGRALMYRANLASRLSLRILVPVMHFEAGDSDTLYRKVKRYDWSLHLDPGMTFAVDSVVHSPHHRNSQFAALRVKDAIADRFRGISGQRPSVDREKPDLLINLHISGKGVHISLDSSGGSLHRRGYRTGPFEAPLNEVLAAGMIMLTGWKGERPFLDPMCGSGTIAIEAAMIAAQIPPGIFREGYGFENWKDFDRGLLEHVISELPPEREVKVPILARDVDPAAVELTRSQVARMELARLINVEQSDFTTGADGGEGFTIIMNPPYGERMKTGNLERLYGAIGTTLKHHYPDGDAWILSSSAESVKQIGLKPASKRLLLNGSLECSYLNYKTFKGTLKDHKGKGPDRL